MPPHGARRTPVIVVTGNDADQTEAAIAGTRARAVINPDYARGLSSSLRAGIAAVPKDCDGALVLLGDMPGVTTPLIDKLIAAFDPADGCAICVAARQGKRGNPVLWARQFFPEIMALEGDVGAKHLMAMNDELVCEIEADDDGPLMDIDTPEALAAARANMSDPLYKKELLRLAADAIGAGRLSSPDATGECAQSGLRRPRDSRSGSERWPCRSHRARHQSLCAGSGLRVYSWQRSQGCDT